MSENFNNIPFTVLKANDITNKLIYFDTMRLFSIPLDISYSICNLNRINQFIQARAPISFHCFIDRAAIEKHKCYKAIIRADQHEKNNKRRKELGLEPLTMVKEESDIIMSVVRIIGYVSMFYPLSPIFQSEEEVFCHRKEREIVPIMREKKIGRILMSILTSAREEEQPAELKFLLDIFQIIRFQVNKMHIYYGYDGLTDEEKEKFKKEQEKFCL